VSEKAKALSIDEFRLLMQSFEPFENHPRLAVAVSGGSDSMAMALLLNEWCKERGGHLVALTVDHQLRPESQSEAQQVQKWLKSYNIPHVILNWDGQKPSTGLQEAARRVRYNLLEEWCQQNGYLHLLLAHQQEDQQETLIMRILDKSGLMGLAGMSNIVEKTNLRLLRPLLTIPRQRLRAYLVETNQQWIEDPSNKNPRFRRGYLRQTMPAQDIDVLRSHALLQEFRGSYERWINRFLAQHSCIYPLGYVEVNKQELLALPSEFQKSVLLQILKTIGVGQYQPRLAVVESILKQMGVTGFKAATCHGVRISKHKGRLLFAREHERVNDEFDLDKIMNSSLHFDNRFEVQVAKLKQKAGTNIHLKKVGKAGWDQLIRQYPAFKKIDIHKPILWSLPAAWRGPEILLKYNMIYEWLIKSQEKSKHNIFCFRPYYPFSCFIFSKSS
jgi:tRNA(Ile)-lysidine synthase